MKFDTDNIRASVTNYMSDCDLDVVTGKSFTGLFHDPAADTGAAINYEALYRHGRKYKPLLSSINPYCPV